MRSFTDLHNKIDSSISWDTLQAGIHKLPEQQQVVLTHYYGEGLTFRLIANKINVSPSKVSLLHTRAVHTLRMSLSEAYRERIRDIISRVVM